MDEYMRVCRLYHDLDDHWRGTLRDHHNVMHEGPFDSCPFHRCYEYRHTLARHGQVPSGSDITRQR